MFLQYYEVLKEIRPLLEQIIISSYDDTIPQPMLDLHIGNYEMP